jgi:hypothetical protein
VRPCLSQAAIFVQTAPPSPTCRQYLIAPAAGSKDNVSCLKLQTCTRHLAAPTAGSKDRALCRIPPEQAWPTGRDLRMAFLPAPIM